MNKKTMNTLLTVTGVGLGIAGLILILLSVFAEKNTLTTFTYDASDNLKKMEVSVIVSGIETKVTTEILALRSSAKFPDKLFSSV